MERELNSTKDILTHNKLNFMKTKNQHISENVILLNELNNYKYQNKQMKNQLNTLQIFNKTEKSNVTTASYIIDVNSKEAKHSKFFILI